MPDPLVSVVIPLFNKEKFILSTLASVVNQSYKNIELLIIDDSSSDGSFKTASEFLNEHSGRFSNIVLQSRANTGQASARNDGIKLAKGKYVAFLDADDIWHPEKIRKQVNFFLQHPNIQMVFCNYLMFQDGKPGLRAVKLVPIEKKVKSWLLMSGFGCLLESTGMVVRESLIPDRGFSADLQMCGGLDLAFRYSSVRSVGCVNDYLCGYRVTPTGWHTNKLDLLHSFQLMFTKNSIYESYRKITFKNLGFHLSLWNLRQSKNLKTFQSFAVVFVKSPIACFRYLFAICNMVWLSKLRGALLKKKSGIPLGWF
jgi:glycosyltransferase involved in cell wall biosynthesis